MRRRSAIVFASVLVAGALAAAGCNFLVGVGDYTSGGSTGDDASSFEAGSSSGSGDDVTLADDGPGEAGPGAEAAAEAGADAAGDAGRVDAGLDATADAPTDGPGSCSAASIASCATGSVGYACTGAARPQQESDASIACQPATGAGPAGTKAYCCVTSSCAPLTGLDAGPGLYTGPSCSQGWVPYGCSSSDTPQQGAAPLACTTAPGGCTGSTDYCCTTPTCSPSSALTCPSGQTGYTCPGGDTPQNVDPTVSCTSASTNNYCCAPVTCSLNSSLVCPGSYQTGYSCTGSDVPWNDFDGVSSTCTATTNVGGTTDYCCSPACWTDNDCAYNWSQTVCAFRACVKPSGIVGDPCSPGGSGLWDDCSPGDAGATSCNGTWCTQSCTTSNECGTSSSGLQNICVTTSAGSLCFPSCSQSADCAPYSDTFCVPVGSGTSICAGIDGHVGGKIGDPCGNDQDCTYGYCGDQNACTQSCASPSDTSCGQNSLLITSYCALGAFSGTYECVPGCSTVDDCSAYTQSYCGAPQSVCTLAPGGSYSYCSLAQ